MNDVGDNIWISFYVCKNIPFMLENEEIKHADRYSKVNGFLALESFL